jgi:multiple sugar transport system permease protein
MRIYDEMLANTNFWITPEGDARGCKRRCNALSEVRCTFVGRGPVASILSKSQPAALRKDIEGRKGRGRFRPFVLWLIPIVGLLLIFNVLPILGSFFLSFFQYEMLQPLRFIGLQNYIYAFTKDAVFLRTIINTIYYAVASVIIGMAFSLAAAQLIFTRKHSQAFFRSAYFLPVITPMVSIAIVWRFILQPSKFGFLNAIIGNFGIRSQPWLTSERLVIPSLVIIGIWAGLGYTMVLFLAGLSGIPSTFYEAARIDGASSWGMFWKITWPLLSPTVLFTSVTGTISALQIFGIPYIMTKGGPENASRMVVMWIQETGFGQFRMGYASALAYIFFVFILILTIIELRYLRTQWSY